MSARSFYVGVGEAGTKLPTLQELLSALQQQAGVAVISVLVCCR